MQILVRIPPILLLLILTTLHDAHAISSGMEILANFEEEQASKPVPVQALSFLGPELMLTRMRRSPPYGPPPQLYRPAYPGPRPVYYVPPPPQLYPHPVPPPAPPAPPTPSPPVKTTVKPAPTPTAKPEPPKASESEEEEIEIVSGVDNHSSSKAKILPVNVTITANAGVKLIVEALNNLLRKGLLPGGVLGTGDGTPAGAPSPASSPTPAPASPHAPASTPAHAPASAPASAPAHAPAPASTHAAVYPGPTETPKPNKPATEASKPNKPATDPLDIDGDGKADITPEQLKKLEDKLAKLIDQMKTNPGQKREGLIDELVGLPITTVEDILKALLPGLR